MVRIKKSHLKRVISEIINTWHRNHYTPYDDPFDVEGYYGLDLDVQRFANPDGSCSIKIVCGWDSSLNEPTRNFKTQADADAYVNRKVDEIWRAYINSGTI